MKNKMTRDTTKILFIKAAEDFYEICGRFGYNVKKIRSRRRDAELVKQRAFIAKHLHKIGHAYTAIGCAMNRDHSSVMYLIKDEMRERKKKKAKERYHNDKTSLCTA